MKDQLNRIETKLDEVIEHQSRHSTDIRWIKSVGGVIMSSLAFLFSKVYGSQ